MKTEQTIEEMNLMDWDWYQPPRPTQAEVFEAFPEAAEIIPALLTELNENRDAITTEIKVQLTAINLLTDESSRFFHRTWLKVTLGEDLVKLDRKIARLSRQLNMLRGVPSKPGQLTDQMIEEARNVPIESLLDQQFRHNGRTLIGLCPLHDERSPSFHIYPKENRAWCYGCNQGGDSINLTMLMHGYNFREAVKFLAGVQS